MYLENFQGICFPCNIDLQVIPALAPETISFAEFLFWDGYQIAIQRHNGENLTMDLFSSCWTCETQAWDLAPQAKVLPCRQALQASGGWHISGGEASWGVVPSMGGWPWSLLGWWLAGRGWHPWGGVKQRGLVKTVPRSVPILLCAFFKGREVKKWVSKVGQVTVFFCWPEKSCSRSPVAWFATK